MRRRQFIRSLAGALTVWPIIARAQQAGTSRIGILNFDNPEPFYSLLRSALRELGYETGRNVQFEYRAADGDHARLADSAAELVGAKVDVIVAYPTPAIVAVKQITQDIPIVMLAAGDPVGTGLIASLSRPGGNITGTASTTSEAGAKSLEVIRDLLPAAQRVAVLANATDPFTQAFLESMQLGAKGLNLNLAVIKIDKSEDDLVAAFAAIKRAGASAVVVQPSLPRVRVAELAVQNRVPSIAPSSGFATAGGLAAYSANPREMVRRTAAIVDKILKGSKPAELPVEQPTTFELILNLKTAKAIGLTFPPALVSRADEVIE